MNLKALFSPLSLEIPRGHENDIIDLVSYDSRMCAPGSLFVALRGTVADGHLFAADAYERGCRVFLAEEPLGLPEDAGVTLCPDTREALALVSAEFYGRPADRLRLVAVFGEEGAAVTSHLIAGALADAGHKVGIIGSGGVTVNGVRTSALRKLPEASEVQMYLHKMEAAGVTTVVVELSRRGVAMKCVTGAKLFACVVADMPREGEPGSAAARRAVHELVTAHDCEYIAYCTEDSDSLGIDDGTFFDGASALVSTVSTAGTDADIFAHSASIWRNGGALGVDFTVNAFGTEERIRLPIPGEDTIKYALLAAALCRHLCIPADRVVRSIENASVPGHLEVVSRTGGAAFVIDRARSAAALRRSLSLLREYAPGRLIVLAGGTGGETTALRETVGDTISELCDLCILTSCDPDFEDPMDIIHDILDGFGDKETPFVCIPDRKEAVGYAVREARDGDIVLFSGKGRDSFILVNGEYFPFSERRTIEDAADALIKTAAKNK